MTAWKRWHDNQLIIGRLVMTTEIQRCYLYMVQSGNSDQLLRRIFTFRTQPEEQGWRGGEEDPAWKTREGKRKRRDLHGRAREGKDLPWRPNTPGVKGPEEQASEAKRRKRDMQGQAVASKGALPRRKYRWNNEWVTAGALPIYSTQPGGSRSLCSPGRRL